MSEKTDPELLRQNPEVHAAVIDNLRKIMSDLVHTNEQLQMKLANRDNSLSKAADEIERLRAEVAYWKTPCPRCDYEETND